MAYFRVLKRQELRLSEGGAQPRQGEHESDFVRRLVAEDIELGKFELDLLPVNVDLVRIPGELPVSYRVHNMGNGELVAVRA